MTLTEIGSDTKKLGYCRRCRARYGSRQHRVVCKEGASLDALKVMRDKPGAAERCSKPAGHKGRHLGWSRL